MVKCRAFILKYAGSEMCELGSCKRDEERESDASQCGYTPTWRSVCDQWIQEALQEKEGEVTPVYVLYNAYLKDNPDRYLDIAQFGKILKSRFKNRKCRRGKQGAQIYVYKNVIIKPKATSTVSREAQQGSNLKHQSFDHFSSSDYGLFNDTQSIADPFGNLGLTEPLSSKMLPPDDFSSMKYGSLNDRQSIPGHHAQAAMTPRLHSGASSANLIVEETSPLDLRLPTVLARRKLSSIPCEHSNYENTNREKSNVQDLLEIHYHNKEEDDRSVCSSLSELSSLVKDSDGSSENGETLHDIIDRSSDFGAVLVDKHVTASSSKDNKEYVFCNRDLSSAKKSMLLDVEVKDIEVEEESCLHLDIDQTNTKSIGEKYFSNDLQSNKSDIQSNVKVMEDHVVLRLEGEELQEIASLELNEGPVQEETMNSPRSIEGQAAAKLDSLSRTATETNRMALGRRWVDSNLRDRPGKRTFPWEIAAAYARDHPEEPLTDTNFAVLIRSKFPSRRKRMNHGPKTMHYYQDLELTNPSPLADTSVLRETTQEGQELAPNIPAILMSGDDGAPVAVLNPPAESVFTMNGKPYVSLKIVDLPSSASARDPSNSKRQRTLSYEVVQSRGTQNEASREGTVTHPQNARVFESSGSPPDKSNNDVQITVQSLAEEDGMFSQGIASPEHPVRDQSLSGDGGMFSQGLASSEHPVTDRSDTMDDGRFSKDTVPPERPVEVSPSAFSQNLVDAIKAEPMDAETDLLVDIVPEDVKTNPALTKMDMAVSDYIHSEMFSEICSHAHDKRCTSQMSADQVSQETEENTNSIAKRNYLSDITSKSRKHNAKSDIRNPSPNSTNKETNISIGNFHNVFSLKQKLSQSSVSLKNWKGGRLSQALDTNYKSPRPNDFMAKKRLNLNEYKRLNGNTTKSLSSNPRKMVVLEHRKRKIKTKRWVAAAQTEAVQNTLRVNEVLQVAFHFFSAGSRLSEDDRAKRLEATIYRSNPAVSYGEPPSPSSESNSYACQTSSRFKESSKSLTYSKVTSLLRHHQTCQGLGCSYSSDLCLTLRAMYTHITIFSHRCQVWEHFTDLVGLHAKSCHQRDCQLAFCLYMKHELHLTDASVMWDDEERDNLRKEFDRCESHGPHEARLHCGHLPRVQIPLEEKVESERTQEYPLRDEVEARTLKLLGNFALPGANPSFVTPIINTLCVTADMLRTCTSEAE